MTAGDRARLGTIGAGVDGDVLPLPCRHFDGACSIYPLRPARCAGYRCRVLVEVADHALPLDQATAAIGEARALRAEVEAALPARLSFNGLAEDLRTRSPASRDPARLPALARFLAYRLHVERCFLDRESHWLVRAGTAASAEVTPDSRPRPSQDRVGPARLP